MLVERRKARDGGVGADAGALCGAGVEDGADRVVGVDWAPVTVLVLCVLDETAVAWALVGVGDGDGDGDGDDVLTVVVGVVAVADVVVVGVAAIGRARIMRAVVERTMAITEAPIEATSADRRERTWCVE